MNLFPVREPLSLYTASPYRHIRPSLLFEVGRWAVVCVDTTNFIRTCSGWKDDCLYGCDLCRKAENIIPGIDHIMLEHVELGSKLEIFGAFDGADHKRSGGYPHQLPTAKTGMVYARHHFANTEYGIPRFMKGWIPVRCIWPMDSISDGLIQKRILRANLVDEAVRLDALPFSPPIVPDGSRRNNIHPKDHELWETDSLGNFLFDIDAGPDADFRC